MPLDNIRQIQSAQQAAEVDPVPSLQSVNSALRRLSEAIHYLEGRLGGIELLDDLTVKGDFTVAGGDQARALIATTGEESDPLSRELQFFRHQVSDSQYDRLRAFWDPKDIEFMLLVEHKGDGYGFNFTVGTNDPNGAFKIRTGNADRWTVTSSGTLFPDTPLAYDIGFPAWRVRNVYANNLGLFHKDFSVVGNIGGGDDVLHQISIPKNTLSRDGMYLAIQAWGLTNDPANAKTLKFDFEGDTSINTTVTTSSAWEWRIRLSRTSNTQWKMSSFLCFGELLANTGLYGTGSVQTIPGGKNWTDNDLTVKFLGSSSTSTNDAIQQNETLVQVVG